MRAPQCSTDPSEILSGAVIDDPHPFYARVLENCPVSQVGETGVHLVATGERILEVLDREEDFSANLRGVLVRDANGNPGTFEFPVIDGAQVIATADEPRHRVHRQLVKPGFGADRIAGLEPKIRGWARETVSNWLNQGGGDFARVVEIVPARVVGHLLGLPEGDAERHRAWAMMGGEILAGSVDPQGVEGLFRVTAVMAAYLSQHIQVAMETAESSAGDSLLDHLARGVLRQQIDLSEATGIAIVMFGAGGESTSALMGSAIRILAENPDLVHRLRASPDQIPRFVEESVRLEPPFKFHYRGVRRECELAGFELRPGDRLMLLWAAANRDPAVYASPDEVRFDRKYPKHHLSFGRGAHFCVGEQIARLETRVMIEEFLRCPSDFSLDAKDPPVYARSIFVRRLERLPIVAARRSSPN